MRGGVPNRPAGLQKEPAGIRLGRREKNNQRLWLTPFIRHALVCAPFGVAHSRPLAGTSLRSCARLLRNLRGFPPKRYAFLRRIWRPIKQASRLRSRLCIPSRRWIESADGGRGPRKRILPKQSRNRNFLFIEEYGSVTQHLKILCKIPYFVDVVKVCVLRGAVSSHTFCSLR